MPSLAAADQLALFGQYVADPRGRVPTGFDQLDRLLRRGGMAPGELILLGGRTGTRKTTTMMNMIVNVLRQQVPVGLVGLDEANHSYISKLLSTLSGAALDRIEESWPNARLMDEYEDLASNFVMFEGSRPNTDALTSWLLESEVEHGVRPRVVFIDFTAKMNGNGFHGETTRMQRIIEGLKTWTNEQEITTVALHQVGRLDEGVGLRYHGATPMSLEGLKYAGEEDADIVLATYRPSKDPFGNMRYDMARAFKGDKFSDEEYDRARANVARYQEYTFLQLLKNRPNTQTDEQGIPLRSIGESMQMVVDMSIVEVEAAEQARAYGD